MEIISVDEAARIFPLMDKRHFVGALYNPLEGHVDPAGVTQAYAKAARKLGAEVYRFTRVTALASRPDGTWDVVTEKGTINAEHVVNAAGLWAREVGRFVGIELPVLAMEHQYLVTGEIPEVVASPTEMLHVIDFDGEIYMRQEGRGMLIGTYEKTGVPWAERDTPWDFANALLTPDLDRIAANLEVGFRHFPPLERAGIKRIVNGPFTFAPDGNPVVGPVRGLRNYWAACGVMAGFSQGGGVGLALSNWMIDGDPGFDVWAMDIARFGDWATTAYTNAKVRENYSRRFRIRFPNEELPAARPLRTTPVYDTLREEGAVFGAAFGLEHALWFAPNGVEPREDVTYRRSNAHAPVGDECRAVRGGVGLLEIATYSKYEVRGSHAREWLDRMLSNRLPAPGRIALSPMLNENGRLIGDFTVANAGDRYFLFGSGIAEQYHMRWFESHLADPDVTIRSLRTELLGFAVAGPAARDVLAKLTPADVGRDAFRFFAFRDIEVAMLPARVGRISFTGELGYEIWVAADGERVLHDALCDAGAAFGIRHFGSRALNSLRLEKSFGNWAREYRPIYTPADAGLDRFVDVGKGDFIGRASVLRDRERGPTRRLITLVIDAADADALGDEPVWHDGNVVGWVTSGGFGHCVGRSIALAYVPAALANATDGFEVEILGDRRRASRATTPLYDPSGERMRS
jgi:dimethylglycine dehydrogenase